MTIKHSQTEMVLVFIVDYDSCFFLLVATVLIIAWSIFSFFNVRIWTQRVSSNVLPCYFLIVYSFQGIKQKIKGCGGGIPTLKI